LSHQEEGTFMRKSVSQTFNELNKFNSNLRFLLYRERNLRSILTIITLLAVGLVALFHIHDWVSGQYNLQALFLIRTGIILVFLVNLAIALFTKKHSWVRSCVFVGFYISALYCTLIAYLHGGLESHYWGGLSFLLILWFIFIPFSYRSQIFHGIFFILQYYFILYFLSFEPVEWLPVLKWSFFISGTLLTGSVVSVLNNRLSAIAFYSGEAQSEAEKALIESEKKYRNLINQASDGILVVQDGLYKFMNPAFSKITGFKAKELLGKAFINNIAEEYREEIIDIHRRRMRGEPVPNIFTTVGLRKNGSRIYLEFNTSTIEYNGRPASFIIMRDYTEHEKDRRALLENKEALKEANKRLKLHVQNSPLAFIEWNENFEVVEWNPAAERIFGFARNEAIGSHAYELIVPDNLYREIDKVWQNIFNQTGGSFNVNENTTKGGRIITCEWYNTPLKNDEGKVIGLASMAQDITERKKLEAELEKSMAMLEESYSVTREQMESYFSELQIKKTELLQLQKENLQSQFEMLKNQVNPHFLFNSLNVLTSLISVDPETAEKFTGQLSKVYRYVLEHRSDDLVQLSTELEFLKSYTFLLGIRFGDKLEVNYNIDNELLESKVPPLSMQILIENAIKHNIFTSRTPLIIDIFADEENYLNVVNNLQKREKNMESTGLGLINIANRYSYFTEKKTSFGIEDNSFVARIPLL
jgi:PAS domain S-box-containing protein